MGFADAVRTVFSNYANFTGRADRPEYWWWALFVFIVYVVLDGLGIVVAHPLHFLAIVFALAVLIPNIAVGIRRLHDTDRSGWWLLIGLVPFVGGIILLIFFCLPGTPGTNRFG